MTPGELAILLHHYVTTEKHSSTGQQHYEELMREWIEIGLVEINAKLGGYETTEKGNAHIDQLCRLDLPKQAWIDENGKVI